MNLVLAGVLLAVTIIGPILVAIGVTFFFAMLAYDVVESRKSAPVGEQEARRRVTIQRGTARAFTIAGGVFWSIASVAGLYSFNQTGANAALLAAFFPLVACVATLVVGWYYERVTAALLMIAAVGVVVWGVIYQLDAGVSLLITTALIGPMLTASALLWLARIDQETYERATDIRLELAPMFAARSTLEQAPNEA